MAFRSAVRTGAGAALLLAALTLVVTWPLASRLGTSLPGDYGDPVFVSWAMGWVAGTLNDAPGNPAALAALWNANIFHPEPQALALSEHFVGQTLMVWPIHAATGNLLATYNAAFLASFVLTAWGTFLLARALTGSFAAGLVAAVVAAFNEYRLVYEIAHLHVLSIHWFPFTLYALHRYFQTDARRYLILAAGALVALNLSSIYYMAYCAPFVAVFALGEMVRWRRWRTARVWVELWAAAALVVLVTAPFLLPYAEVQQRLGVVRALPEVIGYSATLDHYRTALPGMATAVVLGLVALVGAIIQRDAPARWVTAMSVLLLALAFWLSLGPVPQAGGRAIGIPGLYAWLYEYVPGYQGLRVPSRFAALVFVFLGLLAASGIRVIERRTRAGAAAVALVAIVLFIGIARPPAFPLDHALPSAGLAPPPAYLTPAGGLPAIYAAVDSLPPGTVVVEFPFGDPVVRPALHVLRRDPSPSAAERLQRRLPAVVPRPAAGAGAPDAGSGARGRGGSGRLARGGASPGVDRRHRRGNRGVAGLAGGAGNRRGRRRRALPDAGAGGAGGGHRERDGTAKHGDRETLRASSIAVVVRRGSRVYASTLMTTRRFCARPSRVLLRRDRLVFAVADHVDLVQRHLVLLVEIPLHRLGALHAERLVVARVADVVGVAFDLRSTRRDFCDFRPSTIWSIADLRFVRQLGLAELELALILAQHDFEEELAARPFRWRPARVSGLLADRRRRWPAALAACCAWVGRVLCGAPPWCRPR